MTTLAEAFQVPVQHHRAHRLDQVEAGYREILTAQPDQVEVLYGLGVLARQKSNDAEAEKLFQAVLQVEPESFKAWFSLGNLYQEQIEEVQVTYQ
ncbi:tetratricopeptide repeat protein [Nostoc sp. UHCC 0870]|uniref:tetratricopeptide repeat protein n=1 Tax=Nostoc sp. UHCC 0870 TaxID=2914041 RepID=UPI001EDD7EDF|nr:tetratricopeptide repeat protein [Nostoc sp. UHCC 0870]UKO97448.1 tetratricopeptide repeat protein [Nostoc sp. UHCC 0870]